LHERRNCSYHRLSLSTCTNIDLWETWMGVSPMEQQEYSFTIAFSSYPLRGLGDGWPQTRSINTVSWKFNYQREYGSAILLLLLYENDLTSQSEVIWNCSGGEVNTSNKPIRLLRLLLHCSPADQDETRNRPSSGYGIRRFSQSKYLRQHGWKTLRIEGRTHWGTKEFGSLRSKVNDLPHM
jgi:hypothetical protein